MTDDVDPGTPPPQPEPAGPPEIRIACQGAGLIDIDDAHEIQGDLKTLTKEAFEKLRKEILETGFAFPIHLWQDPADGRFWIVGGHQRKRVLLALRDEGIEIPPIPFVQVDAADINQAKRRVLQDVAQYGTVESQGLYEFMDGAGIGIDDLAGSFALPDVDLDSFRLEFFEDNTVDPAPPGDPEEVPDVPAEPISKPGDIYQLGRHRLMCGDATSLDDVERLLPLVKADLVVTDPPYNVNYGNIKHPKFRQREIENDNMTAEDFTAFVREFAGSIAAKLEGCLYVWGAPGPDGRRMFSVLDEYFHCSTTIVWNKDQFTLGRGKYHNKYEPCWFGWNGSGARFTEDRTLANVWDFKRPKASELHPTMKPVELIENAITHASKRGDKVLDLFGGSGTTMIACERLGRAAYLMELDPKYVDVIVSRWEKFTGKQAELIQCADAPAPEQSAVE